MRTLLLWCNISVCSAALNTSSASFKQIQQDHGQKFLAGVVCVVGRVTMATMEMSEKLAAEGKRLPLNLFNVVTGCVLSQTVLSDGNRKGGQEKESATKKDQSCCCRAGGPRDCSVCTMFNFFVFCI